MKSSPRSLKARALQLLAQREHSRVELRRKLLAFARARVKATALQTVAPQTPAEPKAGVIDSWSAAGVADAAEGVDATIEVDGANEVDAVIEWLEAKGFLSNERFVESRLHARLERFGNQRIRHELAQHQAQLTPLQEAALAESELARARAVHARKFAARATTPAEKARHARFLAARGFSSEVIRRVLRGAFSEEGIA